MSASAPSNGEDSTLAIKCMDFCHALASQGMAFSFSLSVGSDFSFSLDAREKKKAASVSTEEVRKKKLSPSKVRRNAKRRQEFLKRKSETSDKGNLGSPAAVGGIPCAPALHHLLSPSPTSGRRRVMSVGRPEMPNFSSLNLDGSCSPTPPPPPTSPPPVAPLPSSPCEQEADTGGNQGQVEFRCDQCENTFKLEANLANHTVKAHDDWRLHWKLSRAGKRA